MSIPLSYKNIKVKNKALNSTVNIDSADSFMAEQTGSAVGC